MLWSRGVKINLIVGHISIMIVLKRAGCIYKIRCPVHPLPFTLDVKSHPTIRSCVPHSPLHHSVPPFLMLLLGRSWMHCLKAESKDLEEDQRRAAAAGEV